jgi:hypothetical protein
VVASYGGDTNFIPSTSAPSSLTIAKASSTTTLSLSAPSVIFGSEQKEHFAVTVAARFAGTPTGTVSIKSGTLLLCKATLTAGKGLCAPGAKALPVGSHTVTASYGGDANFSSSHCAGKTLTVKT